MRLPVTPVERCSVPSGERLVRLMFAGKPGAQVRQPPLTAHGYDDDDDDFHSNPYEDYVSTSGELTCVCVLMERLDHAYGCDAMRCDARFTEKVHVARHGVRVRVHIRVTIRAHPNHASRIIYTHTHTFVTRPKTARVNVIYVKDLSGIFRCSLS